MSLTALMAFALIMSAGIVTPGPTVLLSLNNAARFGIKRAVWGISGAVVADILLVALVWLGLGVVLTASETLFVTLKWIGTLWLAFIGLQMLLSSDSSLPGNRGDVAPAPQALFLKSFFVAMSNPKYYIFMTALLPQFVNMTQPALPQYASLAAVIVSIDVTVMLSYATLGKKSVRIWKANGIKWMNRISGTFLLILAGSVALYRKSST
ncbi:LysE family translocator [Salmonella enterica]|uniref:LysE family translocator n=2 Tax=Salmonella enterica TaxID=28901 RepID=A0A403T213_SALER|nr:LysE family translocator [Salmonella sp. SG203]EAB7739570.1 LysE family translocator [Salmonella enterica subsp. enterica serovar Hadar]EAV6574945.1 LysE family translocator [Salmonella enterica]EBQ9003901.1 LysE family translocator [Salmonella enterica subsp. enterica serovar Blockley]EBW7251984.1 LysE family translocator [Salmonella enterica subsp. enterica serovar Gatow]EBX7469049.1 LysE family translocator [Salmonella enterica subsp. enterica serovar Bareilly]ECA3791441.1 LysE family t